ncbi:SDR family oxidoreductase [Bradyrhizobium sp. KBS0727]|uniref:SDR family oxidoreductase n=1 Tax=unclassified Bradyrhizobium TaxID=2631580 RepID=UPI00110EF3D4|nr:MULTISPECIES: SDR family oxidoreductase [unclassified Bradyrhizobium]QDW37318.1 SDR family oxidoreductase [Bradyrhizobium sp. KBS0725]QDW43921.1 SDR family oxidoreductase [Bradyrhizobium sp. KBS0727]
MSLAKLQDLKGRVALVTGGSRGLGLEMAEVLGELGAKVAITARKPDELDTAAAHLKSLGIAALPVVCDMGKLATIAPMVEQVIAALGPIDILVNNAGTSWGAPTIEHSLDGWNKVIDLNVTAIFVVTQEVGRRCMVPRRSGKVINIASIQGLTGTYPDGVPTLAYNASKGAVVNMTRTLANEWAPFGINVNAIAPGYFPTKMTAQLDHGATAQMTPMRRCGGPEELKGVTALFATDAGAFITGQTLAVDGGLTAV